MKTYKVNEITDKRILGRNVKDAGKTDKPLALFWGASALEVNVKAKDVWVLVSADYETSEPWVAVEINGYRMSRFMVTAGEPHWVCIARNMNPENENLITVMKDTQPMSGEAKHSLFIHAIGLDDDGKFMTVPPRKYKFEFVGDSITSGEGLAGMPQEMDWITQWFCTGKTYAVQTAKAMNADWSLVSQSGWGICWAWDGNRNNVIPPHYEEVCSVMWGDYQQSLGVNDKFDFGTGSDVVVVNLGTNDNGAFFQPPWKDENGKEYPLHVDSNRKAFKEDAQEIVDGVKNFISVIRKNNPNAKIIWCGNMMKLDAVPEYLETAVNEYKEENKDSSVYYLSLDPMEDVEKELWDKGSRGHPGPKTHQMAMIKLTDFIGKLLK